ncbi:LCP family protein [Streptomyces sp. AM 2-1-1]|uniref:LCP family protein n=1 Tax=Streptomyces sp. AM 2-1-1 TaxID=3028709 RepID=UPI0023BA21D0|nr:LCP family protein [Streptomyces sp. AM 2-1-1]WEH41520.1 LCP family protein [Streptomyces sp. AM 2-1-1]
MGRNSTPGEGTRPRAPRAGRPAGNDGLHADEEARGAPERPGGGEGRGDASPEDGSPADGSSEDDIPGGGSATDADPAPAGGKARRGRGAAAARPSRRLPEKAGRRVLRWTASVLALLILATGAAGYFYYQHLNHNIRKEDLTLGDREMVEHRANAAGQTPLNILLIGSDARDSAENQKLGGAKETFNSAPLADVQMLLHVSADRSNISVVSMPRDTMLKMPKCTDPDTGKVYPASTGLVMTNTSLGRGGPGCTVAAWYELTGITIDHFMMIDFAGVVSMADAVGGVPVCVDANIYSHNGDGSGSGLKLKEGTTPIMGKQALQWLRTRYGFRDNTDLGRAEAQHQYLNSMVRELRKGTKLTDPGKLMDLAEAATNALTVDKGLDTVKKLYDLASELKKVPTGRITMTTMPNVYGTGSLDGRVLPMPGDAEQVFRMVRDDIALDGKSSGRPAASASASAAPTVSATPTDPSAPVDEIAVSVRNATATDEGGPVAGRAGEVRDLLDDAGFTRATKDSDDISPSARTSVLYPSADLEGDARAVAKALGIPVSLVKKSTAVTGISLAVGADWREDGGYPAAGENDETPESANALNGEQSACMHVNPDYTW